MTLAAEAAGTLAPPSPEREAVVRRLRVGVLTFAFAVVAIATVALTYYAHNQFEAELGPELLSDTGAAADFAAADVELALSYGVPLHGLVGVEEYFDSQRTKHRVVDFIALLDTDGRPLHVSGSFTAEQKQAAMKAAQSLAAGAAGAAGELPDAQSLFLALRPVRVGSSLAAIVAVGIDPNFVERQLLELAYDVGSILMVALFLAFEVTIAAITVLAVTPMSLLLTLMEAAGAGDFHRSIAWAPRNEIGNAIHQFNRVVEGLNARYAALWARAAASLREELRARVAAAGERFGLSETGAVPTRAPASPTDVRLALFVFILAEEMQKPFLPLFVDSLGGQLAGLPSAIVAGLPISVSMLVLALATPPAGGWAERFGPRRIFLLGLVPAGAGFLAAAAAATVSELIAARALSAFGYAMCTIAAQGFVIRATPAGGKARGVSVFVGVLMTANICGTAIGGILADRIGYRAAFLCSAGLAVLAGVVAMRMLPAMPGPDAGQPRRQQLAELRTLLASWRFVGLALFAAIPGKIVLTGFLFYSVPLYLGQLGVSEAEIGRIMMLYSLIIVFAGPWLSRLCDAYRISGWMVFAGTLLSGVAMAMPAVRPDSFGVVAAVILVAIAHAASISPQIALLPTICGEETRRLGETAVIAMLRMVERAGSVIGPLLVAAWVSRFGFDNGLALVGAYIAALSLLFLTVLVGRRPAARATA